MGRAERMRSWRRSHSIAETAAAFEVSPATVIAETAALRRDYREAQLHRRELIRAHHDDQQHSWRQTADAFDIHPDTARRLARRARTERAAELREIERLSREAQEPPLFD